MQFRNARLWKSREFKVKGAVALRALGGRDLERTVAVIEKLAEMDGSGKAEPT